VIQSDLLFLFNKLRHLLVSPLTVFLYQLDNSVGIECVKYDCGDEQKPGDDAECFTAAIRAALLFAFPFHLVIVLSVLGPEHVVETVENAVEERVRVKDVVQIFGILAFWIFLHIHEFRLHPQISNFRLLNY
jgi:hypothetical protein